MRIAMVGGQAIRKMKMKIKRDSKGLKWWHS